MPINPSEKIVIIGAGPTGLGAAWRLQELGHKNWQLFEAKDRAGGLATSYVDENGFTWDVGGHVQFSHYAYFDALMDNLLPDGWLSHVRESWVWIKDRFVPYPFQNNIRYLEKTDMWRCLEGLIQLYKQPLAGKPANFGSWIDQTFGAGIAALFMRPYNFKVWAYPPEEMMYEWIGERVAVTDLSRVMENVLFERDDLSWGPNNTFRFPRRGGTGAIWQALYERLDPDKVALGKQLRQVNTQAKSLCFADGTTAAYDQLISTIPLDKLVEMSDLDEHKPHTSELKHSSTHVFGVGLVGQPPEVLKQKCWMYFPEDNCPFYRVTVFSNYSPSHVPDPAEQWSLMLEVSESPHKRVDHETIFDSVIDGMLATHLIESREQILSLWQHFEPYGYPTPSLHRNQSLEILPELDTLGIYSRGRFGAWKYEVSNQDHSLMQGVEIADRLANGKAEQTVWSPEVVNRSKDR